MTLFVQVPCGTCTACCRAPYRVTLDPKRGDDPATYELQPGTMMLQHKPDGTCIYLGASGCTIHDRTPAVCREFDCREWYKKLPRDERRRGMKTAHGDVLRAAKQRVKA